MARFKLGDVEENEREYFEEEYGYPKSKAFDNVDVVRCSRCGSILIYKSISYYEGFHLDGCDDIDEYDE